MSWPILAWNPRRWDWENIDDSVQELERKGATVRRWSCANSTRIMEGDRLFLIRQGEEPRGIFASGVADSGWPEDLHWDDVSRGTRPLFARLASVNRGFQEPRYFVSDEHRFVYLQVHKVACSSIKTALAPLWGLDGGSFVRGDGTTAIHEALRASEAHVFKSEVLANPAKYAGYFKFAFVRDPYDRVLSCYLQKCLPSTRGRPHPAHYALPDGREVGLYKGMPFAEFVETICQIPDENADPHYRSQLATLEGPTGLIPDYVGRFENLAEDFGHVARKIDYEAARLPHLTRSPAKLARAADGYYDPQLRDLVAERYVRDFEVLGYPT